MLSPFDCLEPVMLTLVRIPETCLMFRINGPGVTRLSKGRRLGLDPRQRAPRALCLGGVAGHRPAHAIANYPITKL